MLCLNICFPSHQPYPSDSLSILIEDLNELSKGCKIWIRITLLIAFGAFQLLFWKMLYIYIYIYIYLERIYIYWATYSVSAFARTKCHHSMYRNPCFPNYTLCLGWISRLCEIYQNHLTFDLHAAMPTRGQKLFCCCFPPSLKGHHITNNPKNLVFIIAFLGTLSVGAHSMCNYSFVLVRS